MAFNNGLERKKFEQEQKRLGEEYRAAGMSEEAIREMYLFDLDRFNSDRRFGEHTQQFAISELEDDDEATSPLYEKFSDVLTVSIERSGEHSRFWWIDETDDADLATKLRKLSVDDLELLTLIVQDGYTVVEIAHLHGVAHSTISRKLSRLKKYLKNFSANGTD